MLKSALAMAVIGFVAFAAAWPSLSQGLQRPAVSIEQATKIARDRGLIVIREIELDDGKWEVEGRNQSGEKRELHIDAGTGTVLRDERD
ncbi:PepSY domain-containing protein [Pseudorhodoplanes sp.]|uniref:PepSY domain-containing protein n=1 Tax=Pseudorhodoplanes sp. TaxID=1934341 RepID=UPI00391BAEB7